MMVSVSKHATLQHQIDYYKALREYHMVEVENIRALPKWLRWLLNYRLLRIKYLINDIDDKLLELNTELYVLNNTIIIEEGS